ncbi:EAL domain-containing protein [Salmonella enterica]|nr:EAL domain-containing protein [Salmonella enterica]EJX4475829.1 EAL domain-containing protein [Salmonella enterica]EKS4544262.1 EAL domain-containing protein [Salmonella enterica]EKS4548421.1 EAL domain-containing protein [Salmonella enterica]EKS4822179.1 EAL domain-containing protein [Salmonella enterica]
MCEVSYMRFSAQRLQQAITRREFIPFYQAICHSATGTVTGCEVLARWRHPEKGLLRAGLFIDSVESAGMEYALTRMLMDEVLAHVRRLLPVQQRPFLLTFNVSPGLVMAPVFRHYLLALSILLRQAGVTPVTEITERQDIRLYPGAAEEFAQLVDHGLQFAVDDFGTGYAGRHLLAVTQALAAPGVPGRRVR